MSQLELKNVDKRFGDTQVVHGVSLTIAHGEFCVFVGPSGCGKSTLLRMIAGLEECSAGQILLDGQDITHVQPAKRGLAMVFQSYALYPHMSVRQNMAFGLKMTGVAAPEAAAKVNHAAQTLQIEHLLERRPRDLSGGQRQRVAIGRAIVRQPRLFLFDEPLSNLDAALRVDMRVELARIKARLNTTVVYVTHDQVEAMTLADKIVVLHDGRIEQVGAPLKLYARPANAFVAGFIGSPKMNLLPATVLGRSEGALDIALADGTRLSLRCAEALAPAAAVTFGIRPEHLRVVSQDRARLQGEVVVVERLGSETCLHVRMADSMIVAKMDGDVGIGSGATVGLDFDTERAHLFLPKGRRLS